MSRATKALPAPPPLMSDVQMARHPNTLLITLPRTLHTARVSAWGDLLHEVCSKASRHRSLKGMRVMLSDEPFDRLVVQRNSKLFDGPSTDRMYLAVRDVVRSVQEREAFAFYSLPVSEQRETAEALSSDESVPDWLR